MIDACIFLLADDWKQFLLRLELALIWKAELMFHQKPTQLSHKEWAWFSEIIYLQ